MARACESISWFGYCVQMLTLLACLVSTVAAERRFVTPADSQRLTMAADVVVSPDGKKAIYSSWVKAKPGGISVTLLDLESMKSEPFLKSEAVGASGHAWSPDGSHIGFLLSVNDSVQLGSVSANGGAICMQTQMPNNVSHFQWSPDGKKIALVSTTTIPERVHPPGIRIFTRPDYRSLNGYTDYSKTMSQLYVMDFDPSCSKQSPPKQLTHGNDSATLVFWSNDSASVAYVAGSLRYVRVRDGSEERAVSLKAPGTAGKDLAPVPRLIPSPDRTRAAFVLEDPDGVMGFAQEKVWLTSLETGVTTNITSKWDREIGSEGLLWLDDDRLLATTKDTGNVNVVQINTRNSTVTPWWTGKRAVASISAASTGKRVLAIASNFTTPDEIYDITQPGKGLAITSLNKAFTDEIILTTPEEISWPGPGGQTIHGYLQKPPDFNASKKYGMIAHFHGGPYWNWDSGLIMEHQVISAHGYLSMYTNARGSSSYGAAFAAAAVDWPGPIYDDYMAGIDYLLERTYIDKAKLGVTGGSAGAILTDFAITRTDRFGAAVSIGDIADDYTWWFIGDQADLTKTEEPPWLDPGSFGDSPIRNASNIKTPTMFQSGTEDFRTPKEAGALALFRALQYLGVPTAVVQFERGGHSSYASEYPDHYPLSLQYSLEWFDQYLLGKPSGNFPFENFSNTNPSQW